VFSWRFDELSDESQRSMVKLGAAGVALSGEELEDLWEDLAMDGI
jgi:hypothetical protein